jgi:hypothetical protein
MVVIEIANRRRLQAAMSHGSRTGATAAQLGPIDLRGHVPGAFFVLAGWAITQNSSLD